MGADNAMRQPLAEAATNGTPNTSPPETPAAAASPRPSRCSCWQWSVDNADLLSIVAVNVSIFVLLPLQLPQIWTNFSDPDAMTGLAWAGPVSGGLGNLLLCTYFAGNRAWAPVCVQAIGAITNFIVVAQMFFYHCDPAEFVSGRCHPELVPVVPFLIVAVIMVVGLIIPLLLFIGALPVRVFDVWREATTVIGLSALLFSVTNSIITELNGGKVPKWGNYVLAPVSIAGVVVATLLVSLKPRRLAPLMQVLGGWLATLLFMYMPIPQIVKNLLHPAAAGKFSVGFIYFGTGGNALGMFRALYSRDMVWLTGASWGCFVGGTVMSLTMLVANMQESFWSPRKATILVVFNVAFLVYSALIWMLCRDPRAAQPAEAPAREVSVEKPAPQEAEQGVISVV